MNCTTLTHNDYALYHVTTLTHNDYALYLEVADEVLLAVNGNIGWFTHVVATVKPLDEIPALRDAEDRGGHAVHRNNVACTNTSTDSSILG